MEDVLCHEKDDTLCRQNLLAALQKLSLRLVSYFKIEQLLII